MYKYTVYLVLLVGFSSSQDIQIYKNEVSNDIEEHAISQALRFLELSNSSEIVAKNLANEMNIKFGKRWNCFVGINITNTGFDIEYQKNTLFWFSYKEKHILLFKPNMDSLSDPLIEAKKDTAKVTNIFTDVEEKIRLEIINTTKTALKSLNDYRSIALNISKTLETRTGFQWLVDIDFIGFDVKQDFYKNISIKGSLIAFKIETIEFIIYRNSHICLNENEFNFTRIIENAKITKEIVYESTNSTIFDEVLKATKEVLSQNMPNCLHSIKTNDVLQWCMRDIANALALKIDGQLHGNWVVTVGKLQQCTTIHDVTFSKVEEFVYSLGELNFEVIKFSD